ncbi:hypothetical protein NLJ89_g8826 [Agrocybe chaxingu]|uniref:Uncharacterized protein n=1 Tax=Agrocybe chaxingu TaxID=84603 RepID=A0A9W8MSE7_9AGAR|nr:hypothetical protein NLJ89_g8826 [Agrocybe chaxingu]
MAASNVAVQGGSFGCAGSITTAGGTTCSAGFYTGGGTAIASSGTAASGLAALAPVAAAALLVVGLGALGYSVYSGVIDHSKKMKELSIRLEEKQEEYNWKQREGADCENVIRELQALDPVFLRLANRLSLMQQIWRFLVVDAQNLSNELTEMQATQDPVLFSVSTTYIKVLYETLQVALDNYTLQVSRPHTLAMTEFDPPPYYTGLTQALNDVLASSRAVEPAKAVNTYAQAPDFRRQIEGEIWQLTLTISTIENDFAEIAAEVREIDNRRIIKRSGGSLRLFARQWRDLHEEYTSLKLDSRNSAGQINSKIGSLLNSIIPILKDTKINIEQKKSFMEFYIELEKSWSIIMPTVNRGTTLIAGGGILGGSALRAYGGGVAAAEATGIAALAPAASTALLAAGVGVLVYSIHSGYKDHSAQMKARVDKLSALSVELSTLQSDGPEFQSTVASIAELDPVFARLVDRLTAMQKIWRLLTTDAQYLLNVLDDVEKTRDPRFVAFATDDISVHYKTLKIALESYTLYVAAPRIW